MVCWMVLYSGVVLYIVCCAACCKVVSYSGVVRWC